MRRIAALAAAAALGFAACGGDDEDEPAAAPAATEEATEAASGSTLAIAADPGGAKAYTETELTADAGQVTIEFANESQLPHNVEIEGETTETVTGASAPPLTVELAAGEYAFYCTVGDHRAAGMEGTLTVR